MTAYERLNRAIDGKREYIRLCKKVEELTALAEKVTSTISDMPKGGGTHKLDDTWAALADYRSLCQLELSIYVKACRELEDELDCIRSTNIRTAMKYKYIEGMTIEEIADTMIFDRRSIDRFLHVGRKIYERYYDET